MLEAEQRQAPSFPVFRNMHFASRAEVETLFDRLALELGMRAHRLGSAELVLSGDDALVSAVASRKEDYCSCTFDIWAASVERADDLRRAIEGLAGDTILHDAMFTIDWHFLTSKGELQSAHIEEKADDVLLDIAYPEIPGGIDAFVRDYLAANEAILVIQGPPGTGKTRLIRRILGAMTGRKGQAARALYTCDTKAAESDEIFVKFITGWDDAVVVEDADHLLKPRSQGNEHLHRFLTIADGVVRSQGRKIVFSTNLPNIRDLDDALIRPGRCFARLNCRELTLPEARQVAIALWPGRCGAGNPCLRGHRCASAAQPVAGDGLQAVRTGAVGGSLHLPQ